jgi:hypothetical protein
MKVITAIELAALLAGIFTWIDTGSLKVALVAAVFFLIFLIISFYAMYFCFPWKDTE